MLEYRREVQAKIPARYDWRVHVAIDFGLAAGVLGLALSRLVRPTVLELSAIPVAFLVANLVEYFFHRYPMHWPMTPRYIYHRHGVIHHSYFTHESMGWDSPRDLRWILFPAFTVPGLITAMLPIAGALGSLLSPNAGWLSLCVTSSYYLTYEFLHTAYHLPAGHPISRNRLIASLRRAHRTHHDPRLMTRANFNVTFPVCDLLFGTYRSAPLGERG